jgi:EamA-like transporter family.
LKKIAAIAFTLMAFAANSVLCRIALKENHISPEAFGAVRLGSGAVTLIACLLLSGRIRAVQWNIVNALLLTAYVFLFSLAYVHLDTGTGALLLFGAVQLSMVLWEVTHGQKIGLGKLGGFLMAVTGIVILLLPGASMPSPAHAILMAGSGLAWGAYSLRGRGITNPAGLTTGNFILSLPVVLIFLLLSNASTTADTEGIILAIVSGSIASGVAYLLWYTIIRYISASTASTLQLSVPCLAALEGALFLKEMPDTKTYISTLLVLAGIVIVMFSDRKKMH